MCVTSECNNVFKRPTMFSLQWAQKLLQCLDILIDCNAALDSMEIMLGTCRVEYKYSFLAFYQCFIYKI